MGFELRCFITIGYLLQHCIIVLTVDGVCYIQKSGNIDIDLYVDTCTGFNESKASTGQGAPISMIIMELSQQQTQGKPVLSRTD